MQVLELLGGLSDNDIDWLLDTGEERQVISGTVLTTEGEPSSDVIVVLDGLVEVRVGGSYERQVATLGPGELVGEMQLLGESTAAASVLTLENSLLLVIDRAAIDAELERNPAFAARLHGALARLLARRLRAANSRLRSTDADPDAESEGSAWAQIGPVVDMFKDVAQQADRHATRHGGELLPEHIEAIRTGFRAFAVLANDVIGDDSETVEAEREAVGARVQREVLPYLLLSEMGERMYAKPRGYAGDYLTIDIMYRNEPSGVGRLGPLIDQVLYDEPALRAVQGRRSLLAAAIMAAVERNGGERTRVMSMASGPAAELFDVFDQLEDSRVLAASCLDIDLQALAFVSDKAGKAGLSGQFTLHHANLLYLATGRRQLDAPPQDLIYSIGLIDYFNDRFVIKLLDYVYDQLVPGGRVILGNFHPRNDGKAFMDHVLDWRLIHRTEDDMHRLFTASKFGEPATNIEYEPQRVNLFAECIKET